ncbi:MAG: hypothetical protein ABIG55_06345 [Candidatus Omnitrophota bacterium]|nr:hypothetical protein [Candidatus Omnitrophota bacterium]
MSKLMQGALISICLFMLCPAPFNAAEGETWGMLDDERSAAREMDTSASGEVLSVNLDEKIITVLSGGNTATYFIEEATSFASASSLADISAGDTVSIDYYVFQYKNFAETIILEAQNSGMADNSGTKKNLPPVLVD